MAKNGEVSRTLNSPTILYVQYTSPSDLPPLERSAALFARRGWSVSFLGCVPEGKSAKLTSTLASYYEAEIIRRPAGRLAGLLSHMKFAWRAWTRVRREKPDVVYISDLYAYPVGWLISKTCQTIVVQHEHDTPLTPSLFGRLILRFRAPFIRCADICVNPQTERAAAIRLKIGRDDIIVAFNCPLQEEFSGTVSFDEKPDCLTLWHHGSLGPGRLPYSIIDALQLLPEDVTFAFAGYETNNTTGFIDSVLKRAEIKGLAHRVTYHGAIPARDDLYSKASRAHVGLAIFVSDFIEPMAGASNKPFDFLGCTLALLVNNTDEWENFIGGKSVAMLCDPEDPEDIARSIRQLYCDRPRLTAMATRGRELIETEWNYESQFRPVLERIEYLMLENKL